MKVLGHILFHPVVDEMKINERKDVIFIPLYGDIPCGPPNFLDDELRGYLEIPQNMIGQGEFFVLRARGDSMIEAGIDDGDLVIVKKQSYAEESQIVVAFVNGETTLKRLYRNDKQKLIVLQPDNKRYKPIYASDCIILGIAVKVIKDIT